MASHSEAASPAAGLPPAFSLLALHGPCTGVNVSGARWPLDNADLHGWQALGISNEGTERTEVSVATGVLTVVIP